ncbi:MAG: hypothetical protein AB1465_05325 [Patescibacteria group bacterium]
MLGGGLEHFANIPKATQEISRVLKNSGIAIIDVPNLMFLGHIYQTFKDGSMPSEGEQQFSEQFYTYKKWKELFESNGLQVIDCKKYNGIYGTKRFNKFVVWIWNNVIRHFVPFHLSYCFIFICKK